MKIFIDAGHGGEDSGAVGYGVMEKNLTLDISLIEKTLFENLGYEVRISRTDDRTVTLFDRVCQANEWKCDLFISNHINAGGGIGEEVWCSINGGKGMEYAIKVEKELSNLFKSRGIKSKRGQHGDYLYVIRETSMPSILCEFGFIDCREDVNKLIDKNFRGKCAKAVVNGIESMKNKNSQYKRMLKVDIPMMYGEDIRQVQKRLNLNKCTCCIDGWYGYETRNAVIRFQQKSGLNSDGIVGVNTFNKLMEG